MGLKDFFMKKDEGLDPLKDLKLSKLKVGYLLDYDLKTWEVTSYNRYDFGGGSQAHEWELQSDSDRLLLELSIDDEEEFSLSKSIPLNAIEGDIRNSIKDKKNPPDKIRHDNIEYFF